MTPEERRAEILIQLGKYGRLTCQDVARELEVTAKVARRDLQALMKQRKVERLLPQYQTPRSFCSSGQRPRAVVYYEKVKK